MSEQKRARVQLRWRDGHLDSPDAIRGLWGEPAPSWYWLDPLPVLPLPEPQTPTSWGTGVPDLFGHEPRELRLFWERSAVHVVREAADRYRWVELSEPAEPPVASTGWWSRMLARIRFLRSVQDTGSSSVDGWQTVEVVRRRQAVLLHTEPAESGQFEIIQYVADNRVLFWRLGWSPKAPRAGHRIPTPS